MTEPTPLDRCPARLRIGPEPPARVYLRQDGYYALHGCMPGEPVTGAELTLKRGAIAVFRASPPPGVADRVGPVYATADGPLAVPTGLVFVRFANGRPTGQPLDFVTGFLDGDNARGRPVGVTLDPRGALIVCDDLSNTVWRVAPARPVSPPAPEAPASPPPPG